MKNFKTVLLIICCSPFIGIAQIQHKSLLPSLSDNYLGNLLNTDINLVTTQPINLEALKLYADSAGKENGKAYYGKGIPFNVNVKDMAIHELLYDGTHLYRLRVGIPSAIGLQLHFDQYHLPEGARLFIYDSKYNNGIGAFTSENNNPENKLATSIVNADTVIIEYTEPAEAASGTLHLEEVVACFEDVLKDFNSPNKGVTPEDMGQGPYSYGSAPCEVNSTCDANAWATERASVALILYKDGNFGAHNPAHSDDLYGKCSGALLNNTAKDEKPYLLTADHCADDPVNTSPSLPYQYWKWVFMFHHEGFACGDSGRYAAINNTISGCTKLSSGATQYSSDFLLLRLSSSIPSYYNVCYSGWDRTEFTPMAPVTSLHHPWGDVMKMSISNNAPITDPYRSRYWQVQGWNTGTTESGSSGGPLFDINHRIVGQLYSTVNDANGNPPSACDPTKQDLYGKFSASWKYGRLDRWLDSISLGNMTLETSCPYGSSPGGGGSHGGYDPDNVSYCMNSGVIINHQSEGIVSACTDGVLKTNYLIPASVYDNAQDMTGLKYVYTVKFAPCNDNLNVVDPNITFSHNYEVPNSGLGAKSPFTASLKQSASDAGLTLVPGTIYQVKYSANYQDQFDVHDCGAGLQESAPRYFYVIAGNKTFKNAQLFSGSYNAAYNLGFQNVTQSVGKTTVARTSGMVTLENTLIEGNFSTEIVSSFCPNTPHRIAKPTVTIIPLPSNVYGNPSKKENILLNTDSFIQVSPNPSNGVFNIQTRNGNFMSIEVQDVYGRTVCVKKTIDSETKTQIDVSNYSSGIYILIVQNTMGKTGTYKLIKQ